jgi:hypothetical protein
VHKPVIAKQKWPIEILFKILFSQSQHICLGRKDTLLLLHLFFPSQLSWGGDSKEVICDEKYLKTL